MIPICEDSRSPCPLAVVCATALVLGQASDTPLYRDPSKPIEARIRDLVGRLTIEEKAQQLNHLNKGLPRLGIKAWGGWNQTLHGVWSKEPTTLFPVPTAMGATWDPDLVHQVADAMSDEARALYNAGKDGPRSPHGLVYRSPVINISRDPRWGRIQEVFSEDPYLTGRMAVAYVRGLQGKDIAHLKVAATVKHFAVNNVEAGRQHLSAIVDERNLFDYWFPHWKAAFVEGKAQSVMSSYNAINGVPSAVNRWLLTDVLRTAVGLRRLRHRRPGRGAAPHVGAAERAGPPLLGRSRRVDGGRDQGRQRQRRSGVRGQHPQGRAARPADGRRRRPGAVERAPRRLPAGRLRSVDAVRRDPDERGSQARPPRPVAAGGAEVADAPQQPQQRPRHRHPCRSRRRRSCR